MAECIEIIGGRPTSGTIVASGAKNAALPMMLAALLTSDEVILDNVPNLDDVHLTTRLLENLGANIHADGSQVRISVPSLIATEASYSLVKALRASFWVLAPLLARGGAARVALPGGDIIGARPVDMHMAGLAKMGADLTIRHGVVMASAPHGLKPARIELRFPSVGATHQLMMAASLVKGTSVIEGAAREPEVVALARLLTMMGAEIEGAGGSTIIIHGVSELHGAHVRLIGDRIEAGTYLLAAVASKGSITIQGIEPAFLGSFLETLSSLGASVTCGDETISLVMNGRAKPVLGVTAPFPGLATDLQAPLMAALAFADGTSQLEETIFEGRFGHVSELCRMGARIVVEERTATIEGVEKLSGAPVEGHDIRGAAALIVAAAGAEGMTQIFEPQHLRRGYENLERKLRTLGIHVAQRSADAEDYLFAGC